MLVKSNILQRTTQYANNDKKQCIDSYMAKEKIEQGNKHFYVIHVYIVYVQLRLFAIYRYFLKST